MFTFLSVIFNILHIHHVSANLNVLAPTQIQRHTVCIYDCGGVKNNLSEKIGINLAPHFFRGLISTFFAKFPFCNKFLI